MKPRRLHIVGASGSGTTTLGRALCRQLGWKCIDADDYFWLPTDPPYQARREGGERLRLILAELGSAPNGVVVSGAIIGWGAELEEAFDLIVCLHIPPDVRLARLRDREIQRHGRADPEFLEWAARYDRGDMTVRSRMRVEHWLGERKAPVLRLEGDMTVEARIAAVLAHT